jgi:uroporphyrinogen decarboxylase
MSEIFLEACWGKPVDTIPVWFMRQAGRSLPGYRELRKKYDVLTLAHTPELAAQVSLEPIDRLGVDAAILFADIMLLPIAMGIDVKIVDSIGPVIDEPIQKDEDLVKLRPFQKESIDYLAQTIKILRGELKVPLIGFSGAPFTLASYLMEGKPTRTWTKTKRCMYENPAMWDRLMTILSDAIIGYLSVQIDAGAQAVQLFDSWVGCLSPADYRAQVLPHMQKIFAGLADRGVPRIHFATNTAGFLSDFANVDCEVIGVDWRIDLAAAKDIVGKKSLQGNLDPTILLADWPTIQRHVDALLSGETVSPERRNSFSAHFSARNGYIFNLGHGVLPETDDTVVKRLVEYIHSK